MRAKTRPRNLGYDGWASLLVCLSVYGTVTATAVAGTTMTTAAIMSLTAWALASTIFTEVNTRRLDFAGRRCKLKTKGFLLCLLSCYKRLKDEIDKLENPNRTVASVTPVSKSGASKQFRGRGINYEVGVGWAIGQYPLVYFPKLNERRLQHALKRRGMYVPPHKQGMFYAMAGMRKEKTYKDGLPCESELWTEEVRKT